MIPFFKEAKVATYILRQKLAGRKRYPLVLMLEPLFRCNLSCAGCGKIDYPDPILNQRLSVQECLDAVDECGAPVVAVPGGEPLIHREIGAIVRGLVKKRKFVSLCTNALLLEKKLDLFEPSPYLFFTIHLDGLKEVHDRSVAQEGVFDIAVDAIRKCKAKGFAVNVNMTVYEGQSAPQIAEFLDLTAALEVDVSISPGYAYERAPDQERFLARRRTKELFRNVFAMGKGRKWRFSHSPLFLDFLAGNQEFLCTPWACRRGTSSAGRSPATFSERGTPAPSRSSWRPRTGIATAQADTRSAPIAWPIAATSRRRPTTRSGVHWPRRASRFREFGQAVRWRRKSRSMVSAPRNTSFPITSRPCSPVSIGARKR